MVLCRSTQCRLGSAQEKRNTIHMWRTFTAKTLSVKINNLVCESIAGLNEQATKYVNCTGGCQQRSRICISKERWQVTKGTKKHACVEQGNLLNFLYKSSSYIFFETLFKLYKNGGIYAFGAL